MNEDLWGKPAGGQAVQCLQGVPALHPGASSLETVTICVCVCSGGISRRFTKSTALGSSEPVNVEISLERRGVALGDLTISPGILQAFILVCLGLCALSGERGQAETQSG